MLYLHEHGRKLSLLQNFALVMDFLCNLALYFVTIILFYKSACNWILVIGPSFFLYSSVLHVTVIKLHFLIFSWLHMAHCKLITMWFVAHSWRIMCVLYTLAC
jgi:hypothetical protein